jgi:hypothetical protein
MPAVAGAKAEKPTIVSNQAKEPVNKEEPAKQPEQPSTPPLVLITDKAIADAVERIKKGEVNLVQMIKDTFTGITEEQLSAINDAKDAEINDLKTRLSKLEAMMNEYIHLRHQAHDVFERGRILPDPPTARAG